MKSLLAWNCTLNPAPSSALLRSDLLSLHHNPKPKPMYRLTLNELAAQTHGPMITDFAQVMM